MSPTVTWDAWGSCYSSSSIVGATFPHAFSDLPKYVNAECNGGHTFWCNGFTNLSKTSFGNFEVVRPNNPGQVTLYIKLIAIGLWK